MKNVRHISLMWIAVCLVAVLLGVQAASAQCALAGQGFGDSGCYDLGSCSYFRNCQQRVCLAHYGCMSPQSVLECAWFGCMYLSDCSYFC
jgi:hypothetical protein